MKTFIFDKLVRDNIVPEMESEGCVLKLQTLIGQDLINALKIKAGEELKEVDEILNKYENSADANSLLPLDRTNLISEISDLQEVVESLQSNGAAPEDTIFYEKKIKEMCERYNIEITQVLDAQNVKREKKGGFKKGYYINEATVQETYPRYDYLNVNYAAKEE